MTFIAKSVCYTWLGLVWGFFLLCFLFVLGGKAVGFFVFINLFLCLGGFVVVVYSGFFHFCFSWVF